MSLALKIWLWITAIAAPILYLTNYLEWHGYTITIFFMWVLLTLCFLDDKNHPAIRDSNGA